MIGILSLNIVNDLFLVRFGSDVESVLINEF